MIYWEYGISYAASHQEIFQLSQSMREQSDQMKAHSSKQLGPSSMSSNKEKDW